MVDKQAFKYNFSVHFGQKCFYYDILPCKRFNSDLGQAVCQDESGRCCWLPFSVSNGCSLAVLRGGRLIV